jgi:hypothetical protein
MRRVTGWAARERTIIFILGFAARMMFTILV